MSLKIVRIFWRKFCKPHFVNQYFVKSSNFNFKNIYFWPNFSQKNNDCKNRYFDVKKGKILTFFQKMFVKLLSKTIVENSSIFRQKFVKHFPTFCQKVCHFFVSAKRYIKYIYLRKLYSI